MQFVQEYKILNPDLQSQIHGYINSDKRGFDQSMVYNSLDDEKLVVPEKRESQFKLFLCHEHPELTKLCENYIHLINRMNKNISFMMVKNDVTHIKYAEGGFFKSHEDYLSLTSNMIDEYTLIMCLDADAVGGETILHLNDNFQYPSKATTTKFHTLIFRKDLKHEGALIQKGYKEIMTLNLWGIKAETERIIIVSFIKDNIVDKRTYAFNVADVMAYGETNILRIFISFKDKGNNQNSNNNNNNNNNENKVLRYEETHYTYEEFEIIAKIYKKYKIDYNDFYKNQEIIDYYGFDWQDLLIQSYQEKIMGKINQKNTVDLNTDDLILCGDEANYYEFLEMIKQTDIQYMPFKMILAEGNFSYGGGMDGTDPVNIKMKPVWVSVSERNNMLYALNLVTKQDVNEFSDDILDTGDQECHNIRSMFDEVAKLNISKSLEEQLKTMTNAELRLFDEQNPVLYRDYVRKQELDKFMNIADSAEVKFNITDDMDVNDDVIVVSIYNDDSYGREQKLISDLLCYTKSGNKGIIKTLVHEYFDTKYIKIFKSGEITNITKETENYVLDEHNQIAIQPKHFEKIRERIKEMDLVTQVKERLSKINFHLPQVHDSYDHNFCNENVYGNFNFLIVYGFINME